MLLLLASVASWTTELARLDAIEALDAEIDAAEKAVDGSALVPRPLDVAADVQLERDTRATLEEADALLGELSKCQRGAFGIGKMTAECKDAIQKAIQEKIKSKIEDAEARRVPEPNAEDVAKLTEEARSEALMSNVCGEYRKPWWPPGKEDTLWKEANPDENADIYFKKELTSVIGKANTLELTLPRQRLTKADKIKPRLSKYTRDRDIVTLKLKDVSLAHSCAHSTQALSPKLNGKYAAKGDDEPSRMRKLGTKIANAVSWKTTPKSVCDEDKAGGSVRTPFLGAYFQKPPSLAKRELAVVIKMNTDHDAKGPHHVKHSDCPYWLQGPGVCYYLTCDALLGTFCSGDPNTCSAKDAKPTTWGWLSKGDALKPGVTGIPDDELSYMSDTRGRKALTPESQDWIDKNFKDDGCADSGVGSGDGCRSVCRSAMLSFVELMTAFTKTAGGGTEPIAIAESGISKTNMLSSMLESFGSTAFDSGANYKEGGSYLGTVKVLDEEGKPVPDEVTGEDKEVAGVEKKDGWEAVAEDQAFDKATAGNVNSGNKQVDLYVKTAMKFLACTGGVILLAETAGTLAPVLKPCIGFVTGGIQMFVEATKQRKAALATPAEPDPWGDKLALKLAWVDQYNEQVTSLLHDQHGKEANMADDPKLQFMLRNTQTLACAVETVGAYVANPRTKPHDVNVKAYDEAMAKAETAFDRVVEQVNLALQINGQANVQTLVEEAKTEIVAKLETTKTEIMGKIDEGRPESDLDF